MLGLAPSTAADKAKADAIIEACKDVFDKFSKLRWEKDQAKKVHIEFCDWACLSLQLTKTKIFTVFFRIIDTNRSKSEQNILIYT